MTTFAPGAGFTGLGEVFRPYSGRHKRPPSLLRRFGMGVLRDASFVAVTAAVSLVASSLFTPSRSKPSEAELPAVVGYGAERAIIGYVLGSRLSPDGRFCVTNPAVVRTNGDQLNWGGAGRAESADPKTTAILVLGTLASVERGKVEAANVVWSDQLGSFVVSQTSASGEPVPVGAGRVMLPGDTCDSSIN